MTHWLFQSVTLPLGELLAYIWLAVIFAAIGAIGWAEYFHEKKHRLKVITNPLNDKPDNAKDITDSQNNKGNS